MQNTSEKAEFLLLVYIFKIAIPLTIITSVPLFLEHAELSLYIFFFIGLPIAGILAFSRIARKVSISEDKIVLSLLWKEVEISKDSGAEVYEAQKKLIIRLANRSIIIVQDPDGKRTDEILKVYEKWKKEGTQER